VIEGRAVDTIRLRVPRLVVAGLAGDSGKTLVSLGLARAAADLGLVVSPFKKGPDYIDAAWLAAAAGRPCRNLDTFLMDDAAIGASAATAIGADLLLVEGNRGLFDGIDADGSHSTAVLAKRIAAPVVLVLDVTKMTGTAAAVVLGCRRLDPALQLAGVILNRVGTARHEAVAREAVERLAEVPVLGALHRLGGDDPLPGRHLGLVTAVESPRREDAIDRAAEAVRAAVDLKRILEIARAAPPAALARTDRLPTPSSARIGVFTDPAFSFYYPDNLEHLERAGATLVPVDPGADRRLADDLEGLYIGGGFPEVHAARLAANVELMADLRRRARGGLPIYAECGGLMYLSRELMVGDTSYPMAGVLDLVVEQTSRPRGHGYEVVTVDLDNPFFPPGTELRGHEFHYSRIVAGDDRARAVAHVERGHGLGGGREGIVRDGVWASYLHLHALATPGWSDGFLELAAAQRGGAGRRAAWA